MLDQKRERGKSVSLIANTHDELVVRMPHGTSLRVEVHDSNRVEISLRAAFSQAARPGDVMPDGTVFAGISPQSKKPLYVTPQDAPHTMDWHAAMSYAKALTAHGHKDWRLPDSEELNQIFENSTAIGGFVTWGWSPAGWYWSSSEKENKKSTNNARLQSFSDGTQHDVNKANGLSVRCVRS